MLSKTNNDFDQTFTYTQPLNVIPEVELLENFDQLGYALCGVEKLFAFENNDPFICKNRDFDVIKKTWFTQKPKLSGAILNHAVLYERKGYSGKALEQLKSWANQYPMFYKVANIRPKIGVDFSIDYVDYEGNTFEILHFEWDTFKHKELLPVKTLVEDIIAKTDFDNAGKELLKRKDEWIYLDFWKQSDWKCNFFGLPKEQFKQVVWC